MMHLLTSRRSYFNPLLTFLAFDACVIAKVVLMSQKEFWHRKSFFQTPTRPVRYANALAKNDIFTLALKLQDYKIRNRYIFLRR